jgi:hypothetical protein
LPAGGATQPQPQPRSLPNTGVTRGGTGWPLPLGGALLLIGWMIRRLK